MERQLILWSFADVDRSGKVRWVASELGYEIEERRVKPGEHMQPPYLDLNPYAQVPTAQLDGETWVESTAICMLLAQRHPESELIPTATEQQAVFWQSLALSTTSLEQPVVYYILSKNGITAPEWQELLMPSLQMRVQAFAERLPDDGFICGEFSLADICAAYILRIAVQTGLLTLEGNLLRYLQALAARPAAQASRIFDGLEI